MLVDSRFLEYSRLLHNYVYKYTIVDSYWMGIRTISNVLSPETTTIFRGEAEENSCCRGDNEFAIVRNAHPITVLLYRCKLWK
jgi:hypothetical protein